MRRSALFILLACLLGSVVARAEGPDDRLAKFERQLEMIRRDSQLVPNPDIPADQRMFIDFGGSLGFTFAAIDDADQNTHILRQTDLLGYARVDIDGIHQFFLRARSTYRDFNTGDDFDGHGDDWLEPEVDRLTYRFDLQRYMDAHEGRHVDGNVTVQVGRQLVQWANGLTLSEVLDGVEVTLSSGKLSLNLLAAKTRGNVVDFDSSRPDFSDDTDRRFYGGILSYQATARHQPFIYGLVQRDHNDDGPVTGTIGFPVSPKYDSWYIGIGSRGSLTDRLVYGVELVYEGGEGRSDDLVLSPAPTAAVPKMEDIEAWAVDLRLDYLIPDTRHSRLSAELVLASGDSDRRNSSDTVGGNEPGTNDNAFNAFGLIDTGIAYSAEVSNLAMLRMGASTFPLNNHAFFRRLQVGTSLYLYMKLDKDGGVDEPTSDRRYLGTEVDFFANWQITSDLAITTRYGVFFPGEAIGNSAPGALNDRDERHFFYSGVTLAF